MKDFKDIKFKWTFRSYQQEVLDNVNDHLFDGKVNIVAAPGSGKTILGLEMVRRLNSPCLILSPTTTIRDQWGERFKEAFLYEEQLVDDYVSYDLKKIKLINSITYQALYSSMKKVAANSEDEKVDYSDIDIVKLVRDNGIKTLCLDEAHHLQNEWQKSLESFLKILNKEVKIVSLTATPPYDSSLSEWNRYISTCGEIDDEIFVPELVKQKTLCPHQDYILFSYPTEEEFSQIYNKERNVESALNEISKLGFLNELSNRITKLEGENEEYLYENYKAIVAIFVFLKKAKVEINKKFFSRFTKTKVIPNFNLKYGKTALQYLIDDLVVIKDEEREAVYNILTSYKLIIRKEVCLEIDEKLKKSLISSVGKLKSITEIVKYEYKWLNDKLRLVVLTDFIRKELVSCIGKNSEMDNISVVSVFESLRRENLKVKIGCLSGALVILPLEIEEKLNSEFNLKDKFKVKKIENTEYGIYEFKGNNKYKVSIVSKLFENGDVQVIIGTQALLGEGWDSPCLNTLILASYVGSFMLSNQMRGRAIRTYKKDSNKVANIWHLVTIHPTNKTINEGPIEEIIPSYDFQTLARRFECFVGPNYTTKEIESGIKRITYIKPPFDEAGVSQINTDMLYKAQNREIVKEEWDNALVKSAKTRMLTEISKENKAPVKVFTLKNIIALTILNIFLIISFIATFMLLVYQSINLNYAIVIAIFIILFETYGYRLIKFMINHITPTKSIKSISKAVLNTLKEMELIRYGATLRVCKDDMNTYIGVMLTKASSREQQIFNNSIQELLSPIETPRYVIVKTNRRGKNDYYTSFACPSIISKNADMVKIFKGFLVRSLGNVNLYYTNSEEGRKILLRCRKYSFININREKIYKGLKVSKYE